MQKGIKFIGLTFIALILASFPILAAAQQSGPPSEQSEEMPPAGQPQEGRINPNAIPSVFFTHWEHAALLDAKRSRGSVRPPTEAELRAGLSGRGEGYVPPPEERELSLGGIVFVSKDEWTIWFNGERVTPEAVPPDVIDLRVNKEFIDVKWFDAYTNQIFPIRLRPHQRFNLDTRIFLPG